ENIRKKSKVNIFIYILVYYIFETNTMTITAITRIDENKSPSPPRSQAKKKNFHFLPPRRAFWGLAGSYKTITSSPILKSGLFEDQFSVNSNSLPMRSVNFTLGEYILPPPSPEPL